MSKNAWQNLGLAALTAVTLTGVVWLLTSWPPAAPPTAPAAAPVQQPAEQPTAAWLGDSFVAGEELPDPHLTFPWLVSARMGWQPVVQGYGGAGYLAEGENDTTITEQAANFGNADVVVIASGRNDIGMDPATIEQTATRVLTEVHRGTPDATLVVIGPWAAESTPSAKWTNTRDAIRSAAAAVPGTLFIDPIAQHFITDANNGRFIQSDGTHPTVEGQQHIAERLVAILRDRL